MRPDPHGTLAVDVAGCQHEGGFVFINLPSEAELVANGLGGFAEFAREGVCPVGGGSLDHARQGGVGGIPRSAVGGTAQQEDLDAEFVKCTGLAMDLIGDDAVRSRTMYQDIKGRSAADRGHGGWKMESETGREGTRNMDLRPARLGMGLKFRSRRSFHCWTKILSEPHGAASFISCYRLHKRSTGWLSPLK